MSIHRQIEKPGPDSPQALAKEQNRDTAEQLPIGDLVRTSTVEAYPDEPLRVVVYRMVEKGCTRMPVVERTTRKFLGLVSLNDLLKALPALGRREPPRTNSQVQIVFSGKDKAPV